MLKYFQVIPFEKNSESKLRASDWQPGALVTEEMQLNTCISQLCPQNFHRLR